MVYSPFPPAQFMGLGVALVTPFLVDGQVDYQSLGAIVRNIVAYDNQRVFAVRHFSKIELWFSVPQGSPPLLLAKRWKKYSPLCAGRQAPTTLLS